MVTNYLPQNCNYSLATLEDVVYLLSQDAAKDIVIDNGEAYISGITATPLTLKAYNVQVTETEELNERYAFTQNLQFSVDGYMSKQDLDGKYVAMVKSKDGGVWMINPEFPSKVTYTYTLDSNGSRTDFTLSTISNIPMLRVIDFVGADAPYSCSYMLNKIGTLRLNENNYSYFNGNEVICTNDGFKYVDFAKDSCTFTETYDGENVSHKLTFNIPFSAYKSSWHYNLLEFQNNKYATIITTTDGKKVLCGFGFGLQPSYTVNVNDGDSVDHIEIVLQDIHDNGNLITIFDDIIIEGDTTTSWRYISGYNGYISYECVGLYQAKYLLQQEVDILGNPTGQYKCLSDYQYRFQDLNIIDTFTNIETFTCMECTDFCDISTTLPSTIYFYSASTQTFTLNSQSDWSITSMTSFISVTPISGSGGTYTLTVANTATPTDIAQMGQLVITYCGGTKQKTVNVVVMKPQGCFPLGKVYHIDCEAQTYEIATTCCIARVEDLSGVTTDVKWQPERWIRLTFPLNNDDMDVQHDYSGSSRTTLIKVTYCDGNFDWITITQDKMYSTWVDECWNCNGSQMCRRWQLYSGRSEDYTTEACGIYKYTDCTYSTTCGGACEMWSGYTMVQHPYYCMGGGVYKVERKLVAKNGSCNSSVIVPLWEETLETRLGSKLPAPWSCNSALTYDYRWELTTYGICVGTTKYQSYRLERSSDSGSTWEDVVPSQLSADGDGSETPVIVEEECIECGYVPSCTTRYKLELLLNDSSEAKIDCDDSMTITTADTSAYTESMTSALINDCVTTIDDEAFNRCYSLTSVTIHESVTSIGAQAFIMCTGLTSIVIPNSVTTIGNYAFGQCYSLTSVTFGSSVTTIGGWSFTNCSGLTSIEIPNSVKSIGQTAFRYCKGATSVTIGSGVTSIGGYAFADCTSLTSITINATTPPTLGSRAFNNTNNCPIYVPCDSVNVYKTASGWGSYASRICGIPPCTLHRETSGTPYCDGVDKYIDVYLEESTDCGTTWITASTTPTLIETNSYDCGYRTRTTSGTPYCSGETGFDKYEDIYDQVSTDSGTTWTTTATTPTLIEADSEDCGYVPPIIEEWRVITPISGDPSTYICDDCGYVPPTPPIPTGTKYLLTLNDSSTVSAECDSTSAITSAETTAYTATCVSAVIGNCVTNIDAWGFGYCSSLTSVTIPNNVTSIGELAFVWCSSISSITIPSSVLWIGGGAFAYCTSLTSATIPSSVESINYGAFQGCTSLTSIEIPNSVVSISERAFQECTRLTSIEIPSGVTSIESHAFYGCSGLTAITVNASTPPTLGYNAFADTNNCPIYVPSGSVDVYKSASRWSSYASRIQAIP